MGTTLLLLCLLFSAAEASPELQQLLHDAQPTPHAALANPASKYMRGLFKEFSEHKSEHIGSVVRSLRPELGFLEGQESIGVDVGSVDGSEDVQRAELHFNLRLKRHRKHHKKQHRRAVLAKARSADGRSWDLDLLAADSEQPGNWLVYDARPLFQGGTDKVWIEFSRLRRGRPHPMTAAKALRRGTPFLLVFSQDPATLAPSDAELQADLGTARVKRNSEYFAYARGNESSLSEETRLHVTAFQSAGPDVLDTRKEMRRARKQRAKKRRGRKRQRHGEPKSNILPFPGDYERGGDGEGEDEEWAKEELETSSPTEPSSKAPSVVFLGGRRVSPGACQKTRLHVQFRRLGWGDRIIAPQKMALGACLGQCATPGDGPWSNHARLLAAAAGLGASAPPACCVPEALDSATLLFFDDKHNVVLKNFPNVVVKSCACM